MIKEYTKAYNEVICMLLEQAQNLSSANGAALEIPDDDHVVYLSVTGVLKPLLGHQVPIADTFSGRCLENKQACACSRIDTSPEANFAKATFGDIPVGSMLLVPIMSLDDEVKAVLKLTSEEEEYFCDSCVDDFSDWLLPLIKSIAAVMIDAEKFAKQAQHKADAAYQISSKKFYDKDVRDFSQMSPVDTFLTNWEAVSEEVVGATMPERLYQECLVAFLRTKNSATIYLESIVSLNVKCGNGSIAMNKICELADSAGVTIWLETKPLCGTITEDDLIKWYEKFDFQKLNWQEKQARGGFQDMVREPHLPQ